MRQLLVKKREGGRKEIQCWNLEVKHSFGTVDYFCSQILCYIKGIPSFPNTNLFEFRDPEAPTPVGKFQPPTNSPTFQIEWISFLRESSVDLSTSSTERIHPHLLIFN